MAGAGEAEKSFARLGLANDINKTTDWSEGGLHEDIGSIRLGGDSVKMEGRCMATITKAQISFVEELIESCGNCHDICEETIFHAITMGGDLAQMDVLGVLMDCAGSTALSK
jgi:hypothetical protein